MNILHENRKKKTYVMYSKTSLGKNIEFIAIFENSESQKCDNRGIFQVFGDFLGVLPESMMSTRNS